MDHWIVAFARFDTCLSEQAPWAIVAIVSEPFLDFR